MSPGSVGQMPSGWYPDPNPCDTPVGRQRYWDGTAWTSAWTERTTTPTVPTTAPTVAVPAVAKRRGEAMSNGKIAVMVCTTIVLCVTAVLLSVNWNRITYVETRTCWSDIPGDAPVSIDVTKPCPEGFGG